MCETFNVRAYIHLNRRNAKQIAFEMLELLATNLKLNQVDLTQEYILVEKQVKTLVESK
jgi:hypothetical protein